MDNPAYQGRQSSFCHTSAESGFLPELVQNHLHDSDNETWRCSNENQASSEIALGHQATVFEEKKITVPVQDKHKVATIVTLVCSINFVK
mmetsp:Transcript_42033/g.98464  ORF Transcript_42033/g.98464 Transcript_42033/m.98464 type:complete len:90 (+) Transcript_42033:247-516(+)